VRDLIGKFDRVDLIGIVVGGVTRVGVATDLVHLKAFHR